MVVSRKWQLWSAAAGAALSLSALAVQRFGGNRLTGKTYRIGYQHAASTKPGAPPDHFEGLTRDVVSEAARRAGIRFEWVYAPEGVDGAMRDRRVDLWSAVTIMPGQTREVRITRPWIENEHFLVARAEVQPGSMVGMRLALSGTGMNLYLAPRVFPAARMESCSSQAEAMRAMCLGQADAAFINHRTLTTLLMRRPEGCEHLALGITRIPAARTRLGIGSTPEAADAAEVLRARIGSCAEDGTLHRIFERWAADGMESEALYELIEAERRSRWLAWGAGALVVALLGLGWQIRQVRRARREADRANAAKSEFLANMSHEIRTPLNGIIGIADLLAGARLSADQGYMVDVIQSSAETLLGLVTDVLDFSKIEAGEMRLSSEAFDIREAVGKACEVMRPRGEAKGLRVEMKVDEAVPARNLGDELRLRQILLNLIGNAVKFTETGSVRVEVKVAGEAADAFALHFRVVDSGPGIPADVQARLFKPFSQADTASTRRYGGTGLGLAISRNLVRVMGGSIGVESEPGKGSTFWFLIPLCAPLEPEAPEPHPAAGAETVPEAEGTERRRILIAEDNPVNQMVALRSVRKLGYDADTVSNGAEAVAAVLRESYDVILMDCQMPEMDGYQAASEIRRLGGRGSRVPILAMTANAVQGDREKCLEAGMNDYLPKPVRIAALADALRRWTRPEVAAP